MILNYIHIFAVLNGIIDSVHNLCPHQTVFCPKRSVLDAVKCSDQPNQEKISQSCSFISTCEMSNPHVDSRSDASPSTSELPPSNPMALVLYDDSVISPFHKSEREFIFSKKDGESFTVTIQQNWQQGGVAAVVWDAAVVLGEYLTGRAEDIKYKRIIELGAGTGLAGIVAALLGADILLTDRIQALDNLSKNINLNKDVRKDLKISSGALEWGEDLNKFSTYDIILGADIVYIEETFAALLQTLKHLTCQSSSIFLSSKLRYSRDTKFFKMLEEDFTLSIVLHDQPRDIYVYLAKLNLKQSL